MLIASKFQRPRAPVELPNADGTFTKYYFTPFDPGNPASEHVCDITDKAHIGRLLGITEGYYISDAQSIAAVVAPVKPDPNQAKIDAVNALGDLALANAAALAKAPETVAALVTSSMEAVNIPQVLSGNSQERAERLVGITKLSEFKNSIGEQPRDVLEAALQIEKARSDDDERPTFIKALTNALKA